MITFYHYPLLPLLCLKDVFYRIYKATIDVNGEINNNDLIYTLCTTLICTGYVFSHTRTNMQIRRKSMVQCRKALVGKGPIK
jgi:hypothetical protein